MSMTDVYDEEAHRPNVMPEENDNVDKLAKSDAFVKVVAG